MPDIYKDEWQSASKWLKFGFHAKEEFPDYPPVNARYDDVKSLFETVREHVVRFDALPMVSVLIGMWSVRPASGHCMSAV